MTIFLQDLICAVALLAPGGREYCWGENAQHIREKPSLLIPDLDKEAQRPINIKNDSGRRPLHIACHYKEMDVVNLSLEKKTDLHERCEPEVRQSPEFRSTSGDEKRVGSNTVSKNGAGAQNNHEKLGMKHVARSVVLEWFKWVVGEVDLHADRRKLRVHDVVVKAS